MTQEQRDKELLEAQDLNQFITSRPNITIDGRPYGFRCASLGLIIEAAKREGAREEREKLTKNTHPDQKSAKPCYGHNFGNKVWCSKCYVTYTHGFNHQCNPWAESYFKVWE